MRRLMLLRHAKSDWSGSGKADHDRMLSARGREAAPRMGRYLARENLLPDRVIVSDSARTRETWDIVAQALPNQPQVSFEERIYEASPYDILDVLSETPAASKALLVVGHNPGLQSVAMILVGSGDPDARERLAEKFPTAGLAVIDFDAARWDDIRAGSGRLIRFAAPRAIADASD